MLTVENILFLFAFILFARNLRFALTSRRTQGRIVSLIEDGEHCFAPVIEFSVQNQTYRFLHTVYKNPPDELGTGVPVLYRAKDPRQAKIKSFDSLYLIPATLVLIGLAVFFLKPLIWAML